MVHRTNGRHHDGHILARAALVATLSLAIPLHAKPSQAEVNALKQKLKEEGIRLNELTRSMAQQEQQLQSDRAALDAQRLRIANLLKQLGMTDELQRWARRPSRLGCCKRKRVAALTISPKHSDRRRRHRRSLPSRRKPLDRHRHAPIPNRRKSPIFQQPGVLTPKGKFSVEPSLQYAYSSSNRVSVIGFKFSPRC